MHYRVTQEQCFTFHSQGFYEDLNARNKAASAEAMAKYEEEEQKSLEDAKEAQNTEESDVKVIQIESESDLQESIASEIKAMEAETAVETKSAVHTISSLPEVDAMSGIVDLFLSPAPPQSYFHMLR